MAIHEKWFISDTHFFHTNMLKFVDNRYVSKPRIRPFDSIEKLHELIVKNWNAVISHNDYVYHLGDVTFQYHSAFNELMHRLNGSKRLIVGNHDKLKQEGFLKHFDKVMLWHGFKEHNFTAVHIPLMLSSLRDGKFCVHGHTHQNHLGDPHYINVCVEATDYKPIHIEEIAKKIKAIENNPDTSH